VTSSGSGVRLAAGDFDHDRRDELAALGGTVVSSASTSDPTVTRDVVAIDGTAKIYRSNGDGTFQQTLTLKGAQGYYLDPQGYYMDSSSTSFCVRDVNADGHLDVMLLTTAAERTTSTSKGKTTTTGGGYGYATTGYENVWLGKGDGTFGAVIVRSYATSTWSWAPSVSYSHSAVADFNHDGVADRATVDRNTAVVSVSLGVRNGGYKTATTYATGPSPGVVVAGDFNGDGWADLLTTNLTSSGTQLFSASLNDTAWTGAKE
jgi:hypothetical protein